ncbi:hypothetical protein [Streptomyces beihaiensis]|uniref:Uncharacterized protein n=1 Tax=Streptomyces beihaiensis TaxID=2984495 RepID=A0ABT3TXA0_9ACTN|nr:hypothetical protein [Streptomyces beihaiensis]MCX3061674.1 hypothetical protein [Streptomyces beihaiensis]
MNDDELTTAQTDPEDHTDAEEQPSPAAMRQARMRVAVLTGLTVGAAAVAVVGGGPTTVAGWH